MADIALIADQEPLRVEQIFVRTWTLAARHWPTYGVLTFAFGVGPILLAAALLGMNPTDIGAAAPGQRAFAMGIFFLGDVVLWASLARMTLAAVAGAAVGVRQSLAVPRTQWLTVFLLVGLFDIPSLGINLATGMIAHDETTGYILYGCRFVLGMAQLALFGCATAIQVREGGGVGHALARSLDLTRGNRWRIALYFTVFFILKVMGPYLLAFSLFDHLQTLATGAWEAPVRLVLGIVSTMLWNILCCALSLSSALIYADLLRLREGVDLRV